MNEETLDQLIERMEKEYEEDNKKHLASSSSASGISLVEYYQRKYDDNRDDER